ncbi:AEC family transporter [Streptomyces sp. LBUM 1478]|uniref:AEC family transporter n=1 Tax=Streptomyces scabiei TaxID=1930 RepID=UPI0007660710|nr:MULTISPECIES: AEC family transporter [Streptomyces]MBP5868740.1 AEC family transporter [Streptomyces sp. LBUM 1485]MBP5907275.1 AEC family transporter [Streptomyces sp. LBUM 1478]MBP5929866.1 AEC family transporter [Streptomyces sp. LBUM 1479]MBP5915337.1 AEC family transporter [Streptomyces sp. LBUM 1486]MDX2535741.1 AEC family transporter [Streptomyces scabiei]
MIALTVRALVPIVLLIALGYALKRSMITDEGFWSDAERLSYRVLLPALFLHSLATADTDDLPVGALAGALISATVAVAALVIACKPLMRLDGDAFTSVFQGSIRFNNYIGVTIAAGLFGTKGVAFAAICNAAIVPTVNVLCVLVFARFGTARLHFAGIVKQLVTNPLILACIAGILLQALDLNVPPGIAPALKALGAASMPLGLLCIGAALRFGAARSWVAPILTSSSAKFALMPAATYLAGRLFGLGSHALIIAVLFQALPTASSSYIMARQLGGDAPLMAGITATQTLLGTAAVPLVMALVPA